jgi:phage I-like protein
MTSLSLAPCDRALAPGGGAPEWVHLFPDGKMTGRDGRQFDLADPAALVLDFEARGVDLPIDHEHRNDNPEAKVKGPVPVAGWVKELRADATGLWGRVEWTATASEMIARREYRYLSPSFLFHPETGQIMRIKGAGLVHNPNLHLPNLHLPNLHLTALASEEPTVAPQDPKPVDPAVLARLAAMLGLPPDSDAPTILAAILAGMEKPVQAATAAQQPDPARFVPIDAVEELLADRNSQIATLRQAEARAKVELAFKEGHITPAMRGWATALCVQNPDSFDAFLAKSPAPYAHLTREIRHIALPPRGSTVIAEEEAICAQLGLKPGSLAD